ncbi:DHA2 family efflux MFS transporter permease subunit [Aestuariispira ectoiniformans]|uniref:DHA2 family efflux MFS transporter permease subunit n=1 Tax=Aestuariispira ectoiniformans TaxID=2775080 RepID=UPI0021E3F3ED|nr:DHA2 family efflux MFS transporter permease subunit [Aestuariispira ectoiniformans]
MSQTDEKRAALPPIPARLWKVAAISGAGAFMAMLDSTVANLAVESLRQDFGTSLSSVQWVITGYLLALAFSLPAVGWLVRRFGCGRVWLAALAGFVLTSALCALAPNLWLLIAARLLQGLAGGVLVPAGQAVIGKAAEPRQLGRIMGSLGFAVALGPAIGPLIGGTILGTLSWRWIFAMNIPVGCIALVLALRHIPPGQGDRSASLDWCGLLMIGTGLPLVLIGATEAAMAGPAVVLAMASGVSLIAAFGWRTARIGEPLLNLALLQGRTFRAAVAVAGLTGTNMFAGLLLLPLYFQFVVSDDVMAAGMMLFMMGLGAALALPVCGLLTDRYGGGRVIVAGALCLIVTIIPFMGETPPSRSLSWGLLFLRGAGLALAQMPAMTMAYAFVPQKEMGDAATLVNILQRLGGAVGAIIVVLLMAEGVDRGGLDHAFLFLMAISGITLAASALITLSPAIYESRGRERP